MSKQILPAELAALTATLLTQPNALGELDSADQYQSFINDIAEAVTQHCGGQLNAVHPPMDNEPFDEQNPCSGAGQYLASISPNDDLPSLTRNVWSFFDPEGWINDDPNDDNNPLLLGVAKQVEINRLLNEIAGIFGKKVIDNDD